MKKSRKELKKANLPKKPVLRSVESPKAKAFGDLIAKAMVRSLNKTEK